MSAPSADPYANRSLVSESTQQSLVLCRAILSNPSTDAATRVICLGKIVSHLDSLPNVRAFDATSKGRSIYRKQNIPSSENSPKPSLDRPSESRTTELPCGLMQILLDRALVLKDLALAYRQIGNAQSSACSLDRVVSLLESLIHAAPQSSNARTTAQSALLDALNDWASIEQSLGRSAKAEKIRTRASKAASGLEIQKQCT